MRQRPDESVRPRLGTLAFASMLMLLVAFVAAPGRASSQSTGADVEPPGRVGRISHLEGTVHYYADAQPDAGWASA